MLKVGLRPSWILAAILAAAHGAAIVIIALVSMPLWLELIAIAALAANLIYEIRHTVSLRAPDAVVALEIASDDALSIQTRRGDWIRCEVLGSTYVTYLLVILNLKDLEYGRVKRAVILPDSIDAEDFRKLRVWLRWKGEQRTI